MSEVERIRRALYYVEGRLDGWENDPDLPSWAKDEVVGMLAVIREARKADENGNAK